MRKYSKKLLVPRDLAESPLRSLESTFVLCFVKVKRKDLVNKCFFCLNVHCSPRLLCFPSYWSPSYSLMFSARHSSFPLRGNQPKRPQNSSSNWRWILVVGKDQSLWTNSQYKLAPGVSPFIRPQSLILDQQSLTGVNRLSCPTDDSKPKREQQQKNAKKEIQEPRTQRCRLPAPQILNSLNCQIS